MYKKRTDVNQVEICVALRKMGAIVHDLSKNGRGVPDLLVGYKGHTVLVEVKSSKKAKLTDCQVSFLSNWNGGLVARINDVDDVIGLLNSLS